MPLPDDLVVFCADVGSIARNNFAWARVEVQAPSSVRESQSINELVDVVAADLGSGRLVCLGFESPLFVPVPARSEELGQARAGEGNRPWSAAAGGSALATGLVEVAWVCRALRDRCQGPPLIVDWKELHWDSNGLLFWEAFVSSTSKGLTHVDDATRAVQAFCSAGENLESAIDDPRPALSIVGTALLWSGLSDEVRALSVPSLVIKAPPAS